MPVFLYSWIIAILTTCLLVPVGKHIVDSYQRKNLKNAKPPKIFTWRLLIRTNVDTKPSPFTVDSFTGALEGLFEISLAESKLSLVPQREEYCAVLTLRNSETPFSARQDFAMEVDSIGGESISLKITPDMNFEGITTLYDGAKDENAVDLIAVPGLGAHAFASFTSPESPGENWLRDFLPNTLPNIRILVFGYHTRIAEACDKMSIQVIARSLLGSITAFRENSSVPSKRPIIFLGHSLGGLVIKEALILAMEAESRDVVKDIFKACYGLVFFGVPNLGLRHEQLREMAKFNPLENLIKDLLVDNDSEQSPLLEALRKKFHRLYKAQELRIDIYYERRRSPTVKKSEIGKWERSGTPTLMVTEESATRINGHEHLNNRLPLKTDHSNLVKFRGGSDHNYTNYVQPNMKNMVLQAPAVVDARFTGATTLLDNQQKILDDLVHIPFTEIRHNKISEPCSDTGEWFLGLEVFTSWRDGPQNSLLWVKGSPGQGKSVLAKLVTKHLEDWVSGEKCTVIYFFYYNQEESFSHASDILRALIIQLIDCQEQFKHLPTEFTKDSKSILKAPLAQLWELFQKLVLQKLELSNKCQRIYCVIDALDECSQDNGQRSDLLRDFVRLLSKEQRQVKILITSRPGEKDIEEQLEGLPSWPPKADQDDLKKFINSKIERLPVFSYNDLLKTKVLDLLHKQAGRTFLWVSIVVKQIADLEAPSLHEIESVITENPKPLNQLYGRLLSRVADSDTTTKTYAKILTWVAYSERPLTVGELEDAITYDPSIKRYTSLSDMERHRRPWQLICRKLRTLLEVERTYVPNRFTDGDCVYFNHQSVRDYFHNNRDEALKNLKFSASGGPDSYFASTCIWYLNAKEFYETSLEDLQPNSSNFHRAYGEYKRILDHYPFFNYAGTHWYELVKTIEFAKFEWRQIQNLLDHRMLKVWSLTHVRHSRFRSRRYLLDGAVLAKLTLLVLHLDISWLAELIITSQIEAEPFEKSDIEDMAEYAPQSFQRLLCLPEKEILITKEMVERVARSRGAIVSMQLLLDHRPQDIEITEDLIATAASNRWYGQGEGLVQLLLDQESAAGIKITEGIFKSAVESLNTRVMRLLLTRRGKEIKITEAVLEAAAKP